MKKAYLVAILDTTQVPPSVARVGIFSERATRLTINYRRHAAVDIVDVAALTYQEAATELRDLVAKSPLLDWCRPLLEAHP